MRYSLVFLLFVGLTLSATGVRTALYKRQVQDYQDAQLGNDAHIAEPAEGRRDVAGLGEEDRQIDANGKIV